MDAHSEAAHFGNILGIGTKAFTTWLAGGTHHEETQEQEKGTSHSFSLSALTGDGGGGHANEEKSRKSIACIIIFSF